MPGIQFDRKHIHVMRDARCPESHYRIHDGGNRPGKYSLTLPSASIRFIADTASKEAI